MKHALGAASFALLILSAGCHLERAPDPQSGLGPESRVVAPVLDDEVGGLFVDEDGTWVFLTDDSARLDSYERGQVVGFGEVDAANRHLFGVLARQPWGLRLQRLDSEPVESRGRGSLIPLNGFDRETGARWGFCAGSGPPDDVACLNEAPPGTRWRLYPLDEARLVVDETKGSQRAPVLPIELKGIVAVGALGIDVIGDTDGDWLAVPTRPMPRPTHPRIVVEPSCGDGWADEALDATWIVAEVESVDHPVATASEAYRLGADALIACNDNVTRIAVPGLFRRQVTVPGKDYAIGPLLAARPIDLRRTNSRVSRLVARLGAAISTGDWTSADYWNERLARTIRSREIDRILVDTMATVAAGSRPEAAAYTGRYATRLEWNPRTSPGWLFGMATVEQALGNTKQAIVRSGKIRDALDRSGNDLLRGWFVYFLAANEAAARQSAGDAFETLEPHPLFRLLATATFGARNGATRHLAALDRQFTDANASALHDALNGESIPLECGTKCAPDVYGRIWASGVADATDLSRVPRIALRPGYALSDEAGATTLDDARRLLALYPLLDEAEQHQALERFVDATTKWVDSACTPTIEQTEAALPEDLRDLRRYGIDAALRMSDWESHPIDATVAWLAIRGVPAACASTTELFSVSRELAENVGSASVPAQFLELHLKKSPDDELPRVLELAARFATEYERGDRCMRWNLALASALAGAHRLEDAHPWMEATARCDVADRKLIDLVAAYLNFERTTRVSADFGREVRRDIARVIHARIEGDPCVGTRTLDYDLASELPAELRALVTRLQFEPRQSTDELSVVTASDQVATARENLADSLAHLDARRWSEAAKSLGFAADRFESVDHEIGLARTRWLDQFLFSGERPRIAAGETDPKKSLPKELWKEDVPLTEIAAQPGASAELRLAVALLRSDQRVLGAVPTESVAHRDALCVAREPAPDDPVVLDRRDGVLQPVRARPTAEPEKAPAKKAERKPKSD
jgi:hypothetical protein